MEWTTIAIMNVTTTIHAIERARSVMMKWYSMKRCPNKDNQKEDLQCMRAGDFEHECHGEGRALSRVDAAMRNASPS